LFISFIFLNWFLPIIKLLFKKKSFLLVLALLEQRGWPWFILKFIYLLNVLKRSQMLSGMGRNAQIRRQTILSGNYSLIKAVRISVDWIRLWENLEKRYWAIIIQISLWAILFILLNIFLRIGGTLRLGILIIELGILLFKTGFTLIYIKTYTKCSLL
jgi:hypothetical protein